MAVLGRAWAGAVVQAGLNGAERFKEFKVGALGVSDAVLTARLRELTDRGFFDRVVDAGPPTTVRYVLTDAGRAVAPVLDSIRGLAGAHPQVFAHRPTKAGPEPPRKSL